MGRWRLALHICLAVVVFATTCGVQAYAMSRSRNDQSPYDQPLEDSEEKEESQSEKDEVLLASFEQDTAEGFVLHHRTLIPSDTSLPSELCCHGPDQSRAPPIK